MTRCPLQLCLASMTFSIDVQYSDAAGCRASISLAGYSCSRAVSVVGVYASFPADVGNKQRVLKDGVKCQGNLDDKSTAGMTQCYPI